MEYKRFSDFAEGISPLDGSKVKIEDIVNKEIVIIGCKLRKSRYNAERTPECLTLQFEINGQRHIIFTGSIILIEQMQKYQAQIPFLTVIKKIDKYYTFS